MEYVKTLKDDDGLILKKGSKVSIQGGAVTGTITALYADNSVDVHHDNSHQGAVIDSFDVTHHDVKLFE